MTDTITLPRATVQQALEALEELDGLDTETECVTIDVGDVMDALRTALEQQQAEPVGEVINERGEVDYISYVPPVGTALYTSPQQQTEPVAAESITDAMMNLVDRLGSESKQVDLRAWQHLLVYAPQQQAEPVGEVTAAVDGAFKCEFSKHLPVGTKLYTAPPQRKPLTDEEIDYWIGSNSTKKALARAIEAAHNIKEGT